jgi:CO/xanthine dehydrogenase FAD-binding subunit
MDSALEPDELLTEAWFPVTAGRVAIAEEVRRHGDFAMAGAVRAGDRLVLFGVAARPLLADPADPTRGLQPSADPECSPAFRLHLVEALVERVMSA